MKYLFWNTNRKSLEINNAIVEIVKEYSCDFIVLAEYNNIDDLKILVDELNKNGSKKYEIDRLSELVGSERIKIIIALSPKIKMETVLDDGYYVIKKMLYDNKVTSLICCVHLPSKMHDEHAAGSKAMSLKWEIESYEEKFYTDNTIVFGDFNMNPFEHGMLSSDSLHAVSTENDALKRERTVNRQKSKLFFNPMWSFLGEYSSYKGTYYYKSSGVVCNFWNTFDQFIIRPSLINKLLKDSIKIITNIKGMNLCKENGVPNNDRYSDHLPLIFEIVEEAMK